MNGNEQPDLDSWGLPGTIARTKVPWADTHLRAEAGLDEVNPLTAESVHAYEDRYVPVSTESLVDFLSWQQPQTTFATRPPTISTGGEFLAAQRALSLLATQMEPGGGIYLFLKPLASSYGAYLQLVSESPELRVRSIAMSLGCHNHPEMVVLQAEHVDASIDMRSNLPCLLPEAPRNPHDPAARSIWFHRSVVRALRCESGRKQYCDPLCRDYAIVRAALEVCWEFLSCRETRPRWIRHLQGIGLPLHRGDENYVHSESHAPVSDTLLG